MSKNKKHNNQKRTDRYDWTKGSEGIPALKEGDIELILKPKPKKIEISLEEYRAFVEMAYALNVFKKYLSGTHYSHDVEEFAIRIFGIKKDGENNVC